MSALHDRARLDHLVVMAGTLAEGAAWCEATLGVLPGAGGEHRLFGTHNRLLSVASDAFPLAYLEIIAINPEAAGARQTSAGGLKRWFDMDDEALRAQLRRHGPRLIHWVARVPDVQDAAARLAMLEIDRGEVLRANDVELPLPGEGTTPDEERYDRGLDVQEPLYGTTMRTAMATLPGEFADEVPRLLTEWGFGDIASRPGLDLRTRELVVLVVLAAIGDTPAQIRSHTLGNLKAGTSLETCLAALVHCIPYIGYPAGINAIRLVKDLDPDAVAAAEAQGRQA